MILVKTLFQRLCGSIKCLQTQLRISKSTVQALAQETSTKEEVDETRASRKPDTGASIFGLGFLGYIISSLLSECRDYNKPTLTTRMINLWYT